MIRSQIPRFRLPEEVIDEEVGYVVDMGGIETRFGQHVDSLKGILDEGYDAVFVGTGAPRGRDLDIPGRQRGRRQHPHRHRLALQRLVRPYRADRPPRHRARRRQHRDGLLPHLAPPRRRGRQGHRPLRLRGDEGLAVGEGGRDARGHPDPQLPRAQGIHPRGRTPHRRRLREGRGPLRRQGPPAARADRRAGPAFRMRRRAGGDRPGERLPLDRARHRRRLRQVGHAGGRHHHPPVDPSQGLLRRRLRPSARRTSSGRSRMATRRRSRSTAWPRAATSTTGRRRL